MGKGGRGEDMTHKHTYSIPSADDQNDARCIECGRLQPTTQLAKHTPGPWQVNDSTENDDDTTLTIFAPADEVEIATMSAYENGCECFSEIRENAHLIAAAPAMYRELETVREYLLELYDQGNSEAGQYAASIDTTLSQAEGRRHT